MLLAAAAASRRRTSQDEIFIQELVGGGMLSSFFGGIFASVITFTGAVITDKVLSKETNLRNVVGLGTMLNSCQYFHTLSR